MMVFVFLFSTDGNAYTLDTTFKDALAPNSSFGYGGFVICSSYWEQQTNAIVNMWSLQKWANISGFKVVEPFVYQSILGISDPAVLNHFDFNNTLRFSDNFDMDYWSSMTKKNYGIPPLYKWDTFVLLPSKRTVVVVFVYNAYPVGVYVDKYINKHSACVKQKKQFYEQHGKLFKKLNIQVARHVCIVLHQAKKRISFSLDQFNSYIHPDNDDINVWFSIWRGVHKNRIPFADHNELHREYGGKDKIFAMVKTSPRILKHSQKYVNTVLNSNFNEYTAVLVRTWPRRLVLSYAQHFSRQKSMQYIEKCAEEVKHVVLKNPSGAKFLSIDLGMFGDWTGREFFKVNNEGIKLFNLFLKNVYGNKTIDDYQNELIRAANGIRDRGYIALMEQTIAVNARKLIVVGGYSTFQASTLLHFENKNRTCQDCAVRICYTGPDMP